MYRNTNIKRPTGRERISELKMPWNSDDYTAAALVVAIIVIAITVGIYIATQCRAQGVLPFKKNQTNINPPVTGSSSALKQPIISLMAPGSTQISAGNNTIKGF
jgi:hypothetical protein